MNKFPAKNKIILTTFFWLVFCCAMVFYGFKIVETGNTQLLFQISEAKKEQGFLKAERDSFVLAQKDLENLKAEKLQPENFFSQDTSLVNELEFLENLQNELGVKISVSGVSGTSKTAAKAKTQSEIVTIPYSINVTGSFSRVVDFIEVLENLPFASSVNSLSFSVADQNQVNASIGASFYLKR